MRDGMSTEWRHVALLARVSHRIPLSSLPIGGCLINVMDGVTRWVVETTRLLGLFNGFG